MLIQQVLPIYPDTPDAPLVDPKDVKTETMRSRGAGGQVSLSSPHLIVFADRSSM